MARSANLRVLHRPSADGTTHGVVDEPPLVIVEKQIRDKHRRQVRLRYLITVLTLLLFVGLFTLAHLNSNTQAQSVFPPFMGWGDNRGTPSPSPNPTVVMVVNGVTIFATMTLTPTGTPTPTAHHWWELWDDTGDDDGAGGGGETETPCPTNTDRPPTLMPTRWPTKQATNTPKPTEVKPSPRPTKTPQDTPVKPTPRPTVEKPTPRPTQDKPTPKPTKTDLPEGTLPGRGK